MDACSRLVTIVERLGSETSDPKRFLLQLGTDAAGIRRGPLGFVDLARGGKNRLPGGGVRALVDDDTNGQIRHFVGIATSVARIGPRLTRWLSIVVGKDAPSTPDGRLTDLAVAFAHRLLSGDLPVPEAAAWVRRNICD
ncbi:hypothetical protein [Homoserinimonas sp. OAct 916]|uniref:hypothetical protein n=1 Tax=Homoserinimonas sp. OAct 916 TaxID=2211450 RepID=UPI000DBE1C61|nr:hypothetical protein [Homoserinimonas sp. OAct 916]